MGLDLTHGCWHGAYSAFMRWRQKVALLAGYPPLDFMDGFWEAGTYGDPFYMLAIQNGRKDDWSKGDFEPYSRHMPILWEMFKDDPLIELLRHSDCDGELPWENCGAIANQLEKLLPKMPKGDAGGHIGDYRDKTQAFIDGLRLAAKQRENVEFY